MNYIPHIPSRLSGTVLLPASKSLSNRALLIDALSGGGSKVCNCSVCDDTFVMQRALAERTPVIDIMAAGTAMRFLTAYFSACPGEEHVLTGTERMRQRPISVLVDALRALGADISYEGQAGYPPLRIRGKRLDGGRLEISAGVSSQYISALLMTAPAMTRGLQLTLTGGIVSRPYIQMTVEMMRAAGAKVEWTEDNLITVSPVPYSSGLTQTIESDWSASSYWYEMMALSPEPASCLTLPLLSAQSLQGDSIVSRLYRHLGVNTAFGTHDGRECVALTKAVPSDAPAADVLTLDFLTCPDLAQAVIVTCALLRRPFRFSGLRSLRIKETDRTAALCAELLKLGIRLDTEGDDVISLSRVNAVPPRWNGVPIATYHDHRMAMAFAPAAMLCPGLEIADAQVVSKSYPDFWKDLESLSKN